MTKRSIALLSLLFITSAPCFSQTPADINRLITKSKLVATGRPVNSNVSGNQASVSTFTNPRASDRDCKVTALLMMKEINQHYPHIQRLRVLFYDPVRTDTYRQVDMKEGDVALVNSGKSVDSVLSQIDVAKLTMRPQTRRAGARSDTAGFGSSTLLGGSAAGFDTYSSSDGSVSFARPRGWIRDPFSAGAMVKFSGLVHGHVGSIAVFRQTIPPGTSLDALAEQHEQQERATYGNYRRLALRPESCAGYPAIYYEATGDMPVGGRGTERSMLINAGSAGYLFMAMSSEKIDSEMRSIFETAAASLRLR